MDPILVTSELFQVIRPYLPNVHIFADDTQLYLSLINTSKSLCILIGRKLVMWGCINMWYKDRLCKLAKKWPLNKPIVV